MSRTLYLSALLLGLPLASLWSQTPKQTTTNLNNAGSGNKIIVGNNNRIIMSTGAPERQSPKVESVALENAMKLHDQVEIYLAVYEFDASTSGKSEVWNPRKAKYSLLTKDQETVRALVLTALKGYAQSLSLLSQGNSDDAHDDLSLGESLSAAVGMAPSSFPGSPEVSAAILTSFKALSQFLVSRKRASDLPILLQKIDPSIQNICSLLEADIQILRSQSRIDFDRAINQEMLFILENKEKITPIEKRGEIGLIEGLAQGQRDTDAAFAKLSAALSRFASYHHAAAAQFAALKNPGAVSNKATLHKFAQALTVESDQF
jgi:hypothetical protein